MTHPAAVYVAASYSRSSATPPPLCAIAARITQVIRIILKK